MFHDSQSSIVSLEVDTVTIVDAIHLEPNRQAMQSHHTIDSQCHNPHTNPSTISTQVHLTFSSIETSSYCVTPLYSTLLHHVASSANVMLLHCVTEHGLICEFIISTIYSFIVFVSML